MTTDSFVKGILTIIALELFWLGLNTAPPVAAQQTPPTRVVITGVEIPRDGGGLGTTLPVSLNGVVNIRATQALEIEARRPLPVTADVDMPLPVRTVPYEPAAAPGD